MYERDRNAIREADDHLIHVLGILYVVLSLTATTACEILNAIQHI